MVTMYFEQMAFAEAKEHVIQFPEDKSMGILYILDSDNVDTSSYEDWQMHCEAVGHVTVPAGKVLRLDISKKAGKDLSPLSKLRPDDLMMLFCNDVEIPDDELRHISHLTGLQELYMDNTGILGTGLKYLATLTSLKKLRFTYTHIGDNELAYLSDLPSLKSLILNDNPINDAGMIHIGKITSLEELSLPDGIGDEGTYHLRNLTSLRYFNAGSQTSNEGLKHLANMTQMETLSLRETLITNEGLVHLKKMTKLRTLFLYQRYPISLYQRYRISEKGFIHLEGLQNLEKLFYTGSVTNTGLKYLSKLPSLKNIRIEGDTITPEGLAMLSNMKSLEHLDVDDSAKMDVIVDKLTTLSKIKSLILGWGLTDNGLVRLKSMRSLQELNIRGAKVTSRGITALTELPSLSSLKFSDMKLPSQEEWNALGKLASLNHLTLRLDSKVTDTHIAHLSGLQSLRELYIIGVREQNAMVSMEITDQGLEHISKLKKLKSLRLWRFKISDEGLKHLEKLDELTWLDLQSCEVSEEGLRRLKKKVPALRIRVSGVGRALVL
jgi:hypothetical protein